MILNIVDNRTKRYRWKRITAIIEPTWHDNKCTDSDYSPKWVTEPTVGYDERAEISLHEALHWAMNLPYGVTLYLYDLGQGINIVGKASESRA